jgi:signal transduction histidine kinase
VRSMRVVERLLGPPPSEAELQYAWKLFGPVIVAGGLASLSLAVVYVWLGSLIAAAAAGLAAVFFGVSRVAGRERSVELLVFVNVVAAEIAGAGVSIDLGGLSSPAAPWLVLPPVFGWSLCGRRVGLPAALIGVLTIAGIALASRPSMVGHGALELARAISVTAMLSVALFIATSQARVKAASFARMAEANAALARARDAAEATSELKSEFVATVSHELRTPLNAIVGMNELLLRSPLDEAQREYANTTKVAAEALLVLVDDLLEMSSLEAGGVVLSPAPCDLRAVADSVGDLLGHRARDKGLAFDVRAEGDVPRVLADAQRVRQVLTNLVDNAIKFTRDGSVSLSLTALPLGDGRVRARFTVVDTGIGIAPGKLDVIFDRFRQADSSTTRRYGGTGLGLAIAKDLLALMGGTITVRSVLGEGTTFVAEIELATAPAPASLEGTRVLLAEDNVVNERLTVAVLHSLGCTVDVARNGAEAVRMVSAAKYDVVLMDCHMPEMDGYRAAAEIRALVGKALPILALTAAGTAEDVRRARESGMDELLHKPIDVDGIKTSLGRAVHLRAS